MCYSSFITRSISLCFNYIVMHYQGKNGKFFSLAVNLLSIEFICLRNIQNLELRPPQIIPSMSLIIQLDLDSIYSNQLLYRLTSSVILISVSISVFIGETPYLTSILLSILEAFNSLNDLLDTKPSFDMLPPLAPSVLIATSLSIYCFSLCSLCIFSTSTGSGSKMCIGSFISLLC